MLRTKIKPKKGFGNVGGGVTIFNKVVRESLIETVMAVGVCITRMSFPSSSPSCPAASAPRTSAAHKPISSVSHLLIARAAVSPQALTTVSTFLVPWHTSLPAVSY